MKRNVSVVVATWLFAVQVAAAPGETIVDAGPHARPPAERGRRVHGEVRLGVGVGMVMEDPMATLRPGFALDLREIVPLRLQLGGPIRLRLLDRDPSQDHVLRRRDWDEAGDYVAILQRVDYRDQLVFRGGTILLMDWRGGRLGRVQLGHGSLIRGFANSLDVDRRRSGIDLLTRLDGTLLEQPAGVEFGLIMSDLAGRQILGGRVAADWAGASLGLSSVGDPLAPHALRRDPADPNAFALDDAGRPVARGPRGAWAVGTDVAYRATDGWRWMVIPYVDLNWMPELGRGLHLGTDAEVVLGRRRAVRLGAAAELTVGSSGYDPAYFDVFYGQQRWQVQFLATLEDRPVDFAQEASPKYAFVQQAELGGVGGHGALRFAHADGAYAETAYTWRPGPLGGSWETRLGVDLREVELTGLYAKRGRHGFEVHQIEGTLAELAVRVPVLRWLETTVRAGWSFAVRRDPEGSTMATGPTGVVTGAGFAELGLAGRIPW